MAEPLVRIEGLRYRYPEAAADSLSGIDLEIDPGEIVVLAGRSGSGKTSLLRACCGLVPHYHGGAVSGRVEVAGLDAREHGPAELGGAVGLVAQDPETQVVSTTVRAELELPLEIRGEPPAARARAVEEVALALAMAHLLDRATDSLSGGEQQRVALAAALVLRPKLILLDEPTSQLDPVAGDELIWLLRRLNEEWGMGVLLAEHRLERCIAHADRVVAMAAGQIAFDGEPETFLEWALANDRALTTPAARLFDLAGITPPPRSVRSARAALKGGQLPLTEKPRRQAVSGSPAKKRDQPPKGALQVRNLWVALDDRDVLRGIDLSLRPGERVALMGRNGAGKSTLLRTAAGLIKPLRGRVDSQLPVVLLPQNPGDVLLHERVADELPGELGRAALVAAGLEWAAGRDARDLSGGERQRLALAVVAAGREATPGVVCLDEPTRGMDQARKDDLGDWLRQIARAGSAVVVATHDVELAATFADRVLLLGEGQLIADGHPDEILSGGWYFATEVARILDSPGATTPQQGAALIRSAQARSSTEVSR